ADCDLPASSPTAAHLRRIELRTLVVLHISPPASSWVAALISSIAVSLELGRTLDSFGISDRSAARLWPYTVWLSVYPSSNPCVPIETLAGVSGTVDDYERDSRRQLYGEPI
ncbi:MAG TPA: hypothetical protein VK390_17535, partial [Propionibacteriaceae bacterium]|nr:hypothetical protein [Propionibacteriaceae bacterium]